MQSDYIEVAICLFYFIQDSNPDSFILCMVVYPFILCT